MPKFKLSTTAGPVWFATRHTRPKDIIRSFKQAARTGAIKNLNRAVEVKGIQGISESAFNRSLANLGLSPGGQKQVRSPQPQTSRVGPTTVDPINQRTSAVNEVMKQIKQLEEEILGFQRDIPSPIEERQRLTKQLGLEEQRGRLQPLREAASRVTERITGLPGELKQRVGEFLVPERFRARREDIEREELIGQLETLQQEEDLIQTAIQEAEDRVDRILNLRGEAREQQLAPLESALGFLRKRLNEVQQERNFARQRAKDVAAEARRVASAARKASKQAEKERIQQLESNLMRQLTDLANQMRGQTGKHKVDREKATRDLLNSAALLASQNPGVSASALRAHASSLIRTFPSRSGAGSSISPEDAADRFE